MRFFFRPMVTVPPRRRLRQQSLVPIPKAPADTAHHPAPVPAAAVPVPAILQLGDYAIGSGYCSHLHGHPDIRY